MQSVGMAGRRSDQVSRTLSDNVGMRDVAFVGIDFVGRIERLCHNNIVLIEFLAEYDNVTLDKSGQSPVLAIDAA